MRSRGVKVILMGRILEILYNRKVPSCNGMTSREITAELREVEFNPSVRNFVKRSGGITFQKVAHLLTEMAGKSSQPPWGIYGASLVRRRCRGKEVGIWSVRGKYG